MTSGFRRNAASMRRNVDCPVGDRSDVRARSSMSHKCTHGQPVKRGLGSRRERLRPSVREWKRLSTTSGLTSRVTSATRIDE